MDDDGRLFTLGTVEDAANSRLAGASDLKVLTVGTEQFLIAAGTLDRGFTMFQIDSTPGQEGALIQTDRIWTMGVNSRLDGIIPTPVDQNPCAQSRIPMVMMRHGWSTIRFHAAQA